MPIKRVLFNLFLTVFLACSQIAASAVLQLDAEQGRIDLQDSLEWFVDERGKMGVAEIVADTSRFKKVPKSASYPRSTDPYWFRLNLLLQEESSTRWLLELAYTQLDYLDLYSRTGKEPWRHVSTGDSQPLSSRDVRHPHPVFKVPLQSGEVTEILLRVQSSTSIMVPLTLWRDDLFVTHSQDMLLINGVFYGVLLALIFYNLFLYPTVRDSIYLWFALYLTSFVLFQFSLDGFSTLYFWPDSPVFADRMVTIALWICMGAGLKFTQLIGKTQQFLPRLDHLFHMLSLCCFLLAMITALFGPTIVFSLLPLMAIFVVILILWSLYIAWRSGYRPARFALLAYLPQLPGAFLLVARTLNWVEPTFWSEHLSIIGVALSSILLSFALADRINAMREEYAKAQRQFSHQLIKAQDNERKRIAVELHDGVGQNLSFLANALKRLHRQEGCILPDSVDEVARDAIEEIRTISHHLHPHLLDKLGLVAAIEAIAERIEEQSGIQCIVSMDETDTALPDGAVLHLYRIAQEALCNAVRHSEASRIELTLRKNGSSIEFTVEDNGRGLSDDATTTTGLGLESITERAKLLDGRVNFENIIPHGLKLTISIPDRVIE